MKLQEFKSLVKNAKQSTKDTYNYIREFRLIKVLESKDYRIQQDKKCSKCGHIEKKRVYFTLKRDKGLSVFEASLIYALFVYNERPRDYAKYDECKAGQEFIEALTIEQL